MVIGHILLCPILAKPYRLEYLTRNLSVFKTLGTCCLSRILKFVRRLLIKQLNLSLLASPIFGSTPLIIRLMFCL